MTQKYHFENPSKNNVAISLNFPSGQKIVTGSNNFVWLLGGRSIQRATGEIEKKNTKPEVRPATKRHSNTRKYWNSTSNISLY